VCVDQKAQLLDVQTGPMRMPPRRVARSSLASALWPSTTVAPPRFVTLATAISTSPPAEPPSPHPLPGSSDFAPAPPPRLLSAPSAWSPGVPWRVPRWLVLLLLCLFRTRRVSIFLAPTICGKTTPYPRLGSYY
jgi:hypothetical protein